jgi:adenosylhomocysteine nucleosidase
MSGENGSSAGTPPAADSQVAVLAALSVERAPLQRHVAAARGCIIYQTGPGAVRAAESAREALARGATALVSWGLAGALVGGVVPGTVVLPRAVAVPAGQALACDAAWQAALVAALAPEFTIEQRCLLGAGHVLATPAAKASGARTTGAVAVDLESAAVAAAARRAGARFAVIRVIVDAHEDELPESVEHWIDERGNRRFAAALDAAVAPSQWPALWMLGRRYRLARAVLDRLARRLLPDGFLLPAAV